ncbi:MAG: tetratricopeptide repeat protein [Myxococcales bacterium]|nr:tetratricopeptide repeat protein [Myxococcales bacterium]
MELGERACELGDLTGCVDLAVLLAFGSGGATRDLARAESLLREVCNLDGPGDGGRSCSTLALLLAGPAIASGGTTPADTWKLHDRACQNGHVEACAMMAQHHYSEGRYGDAIAVADEVIDELPDRWSMRYARGLSLLNLGEPKRAIPDLAKLCELRQDLEYCPLWLFSARRRAGEPAEAALEAAHRRLGDEAWPEPIFRFYLGRLSQRALLTKAKDRDPRRQLEKECEAYYYVGQELLAAGQRKAAAGFFKKAVATGISEFIEYAGAGAELHLLGAAGGEPLPLTP